MVTEKVEVAAALEPHSGSDPEATADSANDSPRKDVETASLHVDGEDIDRLGYAQEMTRNRSMFVCLFQTLAIAAIPYGEGGPLINAIYGGGPLSIFVGWIVVCLLDECIAVSLAELASRYPTSAGPYYWAFQIASNHRDGRHGGEHKNGIAVLLSFVNGWTWLIGNWTITLSVNFGFASLISGTISMYHPDWNANDWQLLLIFYAVCIGSFCICAFANKYLPQVDMLAAGVIVVTCLVVLITLSITAKAGRRSAAWALGHYDTSLAGWGGFTFFIGLLPPAYTFSALGMVSSMSEEVSRPAIKMPKAISLCVPVGGVAGLVFVLALVFTLPPLEDILKAPAAQALPYIFHVVTGSPGGGLGLTFLVLVITLLCSISITVAASRATWAFARDDALPFSKVWAHVDKHFGVPINGLALMTVVQMLLGLINLGSTSAFIAFISVGVVALALSYAIPIFLSLLHNRKEVSKAQWHCPPLIGYTVNIIAVAWICFELVLFCMPVALPVTKVTMNYSSVVLVGFMVFGAAWYAAVARKCTFPVSVCLLVLLTDIFQLIRDHRNLMGFNLGWLVIYPGNFQWLRCRHLRCHSCQPCMSLEVAMYLSPCT